MNVQERALTSNSAKFFPLIDERTEIVWRGEKNVLVDEQFELNSNDLNLYLFPTEDSVDLRELDVSIGKRVHLIVPDGTWRQTKRIKRRSNQLKNLPCIHLTGVGTSRYPLRSQTLDEGLCTYEAIAYALEILEGRERIKPLWPLFELFCKRSLDARNGRGLNHRGEFVSI